LSEGTRDFVLLNAPHPHLSGSGGIDIAVDHVKPLVLVRVLIQAHLVMHVRGSPTATIQDCAPLDVEYPIRRVSTNRSEDSTARAEVTATSTRRIIGALVCPQPKDGVRIRTNSSVSRWQTHADPIGVMGRGAYEVESPIGIDVHAVVGLIIQREGERQADKRRAVIDVITGIRRSWHDRVGSRSNRVIAWRTTLDCVVPTEVLISVASFSSDRPSSNARRHAASKVEVHGERSCASIDRHSGHAAASIARQGQIAHLD